MLQRGGLSKASEGRFANPSRGHRPGGHLLSFLALLGMVLASPAIAQYDLRPFEEHPVEISAAFGAEMAVLRLEAAAALFEAGVEEDGIEEILEGLETEFMRFGAALSEVDRELFERTEEAFEAIEEASDPALAASEALPIAREVRAAVSAPLVAEPADAAAVMSLLLLSETGVAEGWEEAAEGEVGPYAVAWAGMPRLWQLWEELRPQANENQIFEIEDQLNALQELFQMPTPPDMAGADPEEGEGAAVHVAGFLEDVSGAWLFPDRDLAALLANTGEVAGRACAAYETGDELQGDSHLAWVAFAYGEYLSGTLNLFVPEATAVLDELLGGVLGAEEEDEDEASGGQGADDEASAEFVPSTSCEPMLEAFEQAGAALGL